MKSLIKVTCQADQGFNRHCRARSVQQLFHRRHLHHVEDFKHKDHLGLGVETFRHVLRERQRGLAILVFGQHVLCILVHITFWQHAVSVFLLASMVSSSSLPSIQLTCQYFEVSDNPFLYDAGLALTKRSDGEIFGRQNVHWRGYGNSHCTCVRWMAIYLISRSHRHRGHTFRPTLWVAW